VEAKFSASGLVVLGVKKDLHEHTPKSRGDVFGTRFSLAIVIFS
jgi:hypothetical protein